MNDVALGAEEVAAKEFPVAFRGFAQHEVRAFLAQVAAELAATRERERLQRERLEAAESRASDRALSDEEIEAALGQEAGRVLQAAREAAAEIRSRAEDQVARLVRDASGEGSRAHLEAESLLALRTEEAERISVEIQAQAQTAAEEVLEGAKARGREMVAEAQAVRERVLKDLARRRRAAHQQLEQLRAGRERLLEAYRVVRSTLDEATRELSVAEVEARAAAETAALRVGSQREPTVEELEAELVGARDIGLAPAWTSGAPPLEGEAPVVEPSAGTGWSRPRHSSRKARLSEARGPVEPTVPEAGPAGRRVGPAGAAVSGADQPGPVTAPHGPPPAASEPEALEPELARVDYPPPDESEPDESEPDLDRADTLPVSSGPQPASSPLVEEPSGSVASPSSSSSSSPSASLRSGSTGLPGSEVDDLAGGTEAVPAKAAADQAVTDEPVRSEAAANQPATAEPAAAADRAVAAEPATAEPAAADQPATAEPAAADQPATAEPAAADQPATAEPAAADQPATAEPAAADQPATDEPATDGGQGPHRHVEDLFARLRAERAAAVARAEAVLATPSPSPAVSEVVASTNGSAASRASAVAPEPELTTDDEDLLEARDTELEAVERSLVKALKRALVDEQNEVLDVLRRKGGGVPLVELLPGPSDHTARYLAAVGSELRAAAARGAGVGNDPPSVDDLAVGLAAGVTADLRARLQRVLGAAEGDVAPMVDGISSAYREWKTTRAEPLARHHASAAHSRGRFASAPVGKLRWVVDTGEGPCPDCDDNALAGAIDKGESFPTGQPYPPAHPGCRCIIAVEPV